MAVAAAAGDCAQSTANKEPKEKRENKNEKEKEKKKGLVAFETVAEIHDTDSNPDHAACLSFLFFFWKKMTQVRVYLYTCVKA
jgi:hypothetical protein